MEEVKRNCTTCKHSMLKVCDALKNNEEYQNIDIKDYLARHKFRSNFICDNYNSMFIEYPIEVSKINTESRKKGYKSRDVGKFVKITSCKEEYKGKTFLGLYLGDLPISPHIRHNIETKELTVGFTTNPAIFVFDLNEIVYGCESWWGIIEKEEDLKDITPEDIDNVWYVKALKSLTKTEE